jgi:hypothetical protein
LNDLIPILQPLKGKFGSKESLCDCEYDYDEKGKPILKFSIAIANTGKVPLWIILGKEQIDKDGNTIAPAKQKIYEDDGSEKYKDVGFFTKHIESDEIENHVHWHYKDIASLELVDKNGKVVASSKKDGYCLADTFPYNSNSPPLFSASGCEQKTEVGLTVGWADQYYRETEDQYIEIENIPSGKYHLRLTINKTDLVYDFKDPAVVEVNINKQLGNVEVEKGCITQ